MHPELIASSEQARVFDQPENNRFDSKQIIELLRALGRVAKATSSSTATPVDEADVAGVPRPLPRSRGRSLTRYRTVM
jgi:hypothetical protein